MFRKQFVHKQNTSSKMETDVKKQQKKQTIEEEPITHWKGYIKTNTIAIQFNTIQYTTCKVYARHSTHTFRS